MSVWTVRNKVFVHALVSQTVLSNPVQTLPQALQQTSNAVSKYKPIFNNPRQTLRSISPTQAAVPALPPSNHPHKDWKPLKYSQSPRLLSLEWSLIFPRLRTDKSLGLLLALMRQLFMRCNTSTQIKIV